MKKLVFIATFIICSTAIVAQNKNVKKTNTEPQKVEQTCNLQGTVQYRYNDYIGYKVDVGAEVYVYPKEKFSEIFTLWQEYNQLMKYKMSYLGYGEYNISNANRRSISGYSKERENKLDSITTHLIGKYTLAKDDYVNLSIIDNSGKYSMSVPYGEYIVVFKSKNRTRLQLFELSGRLHFESINANKQALLVSCEFDY